jgi:hypothetical protein
MEALADVRLQSARIPKESGAKGKEMTGKWRGVGKMGKSKGLWDSEWDCEKMKRTMRRWRDI